MIQSFESWTLEGAMDPIQIEIHEQESRKRTYEPTKSQFGHGSRLKPGLKKDKSLMTFDLCPR
jgi:hypothetical protein